MLQIHACRGAEGIKYLQNQCQHTNACPASSLKAVPLTVSKMNELVVRFYVCERVTANFITFLAVVLILFIKLLAHEKFN